MKGVLITTRRKARARADRKAFSTLVHTPATGAVALPAGARLGFTVGSNIPKGEAVASVKAATERTIVSPGLKAGERMVLDFAERAAVVTPEQGVTLELDIGLGVWAKIGEGV